jgi:hypothetical protein
MRYGVAASTLRERTSIAESAWRMYDGPSVNIATAINNAAASALA